MAGEKNNATSSWSGYNHQGQVGIFLALKELNMLIQNDEDFRGYSVQFEKEDGEDIDIVKGIEVISRHQVKAKKNKKNLNDYKDVLTGFKEDGVEENSRYLHTICDVIGFELSEEEFKELPYKPKFIPNDKNVKLYEYPDGCKYCDLSNVSESKIDSFCKEEIKSLLIAHSPSLKDDDEHIKETLFELKNLLCTKIREAHEAGGSANPVILFPEIYNIVTSTEKRERQSIRRAKGLFSLYWNESFDNDVDNTIINEILNLADDDFKNLLIDMHPDNSISKLQDLNNLDNLIDRGSIKYILYNFFRWYKKEKFILNNLYYQTNQESFRLSMIHQPKAAAGEVKNDIMKNIGFIRASFNTDYLINMNIEGKKFFEVQPIDEEGKEKLKSGLLGNEKDNIFSINLEYIDYEKTVLKLREDQNSDE